MSRSPITYTGVIVAVFGVVLIALNAIVGDNCWGTFKPPQQQSFEKSNPCPQKAMGIMKCIPGDAGTIVKPIFCSFWLSYLFVGIVSILAGASLFVFSQLRVPKTEHI